MASNVTIIVNPTVQEIEALSIQLPQDDDIISKLKRDNVQIELKVNDVYIFSILHIPEYDNVRKAIQKVEVNIFYDKAAKRAQLFAYNTNYFFEKYKDDIQSLNTNSFSTFIKGFLDIILEDESKIVDHIIRDTEQVKNEYYGSTDTSKIIRHLTQNEINISSLKLMSSNLNKLLDLLEKQISKTGMDAIEYKRIYIYEELEYEHEFCKTLMDSINTKFQVHSSETLYIFTKLSYMIFVSTLIVGFFTLSHADDSSGKIFTIMSILFSLVSILLVQLLFKRPK